MQAKLAFFALAVKVYGQQGGRWLLDFFYAAAHQQPLGESAKAAKKMGIHGKSLAQAAKSNKG